jgi:outer membrane protein assembly factor BamB
VPIDFQFRQTDDKGKVVTPERGIAWKADLGSMTVIPPVIADGLVWVGTNGRDPGDDKIPDRDWDGGVLMCFRESDGKPLWKRRTTRLKPYVLDFPRAALGSAPLVEKDRLWYVNNRNEVVCLDIGPLKAGTGDPKEVWNLDTIEKLKVFPHRPNMHFGFIASVAGYKDKLYVVTHNGVDDSNVNVNVPAPDAPSLVCLEKATGKVLWTDNSPGKNILDYQISSPLVVDVNGKPQVIVGQGDGWLRAFEPNTGKLLWKCDLNPKNTKWERNGAATRNYVVATPLVYENRVYVATGQAEHYIGPADLVCVDPTKTGDVSRELDDGPQKGKPNPNSAVVWSTPREVPADAPRIVAGKNRDEDLLRRRDFYFGRSIAGCVAHDGLVYAADVQGYVYCFDAKTGRLYWADDLKGSVRGQLLWADGMVFVATDDGYLTVFAHGKEKKLVKRIEHENSLIVGPVFANGTLYLTTENTLFAVRRPK